MRQILFVTSLLLVISYQSFTLTTQDKSALIDELVTKLKDHYVLVEQLDVINSGLQDLENRMPIIKHNQMQRLLS